MSSSTDNNLRLPLNAGGTSGNHAPARVVGIDAGAETLKLVELLRDETGLRPGRRHIVEHGKKAGPTLLATLREWDWASVSSCAVSGRLAGQFRLPRIPTKQAQLRAYRSWFGREPATIVNIGSHGFSVLEARANELTVFRENGRCSQGTGNFLRQLVERFSLTVEEASRLCADVPNPAPLSGRCPVILKTDMTHLANKGEDRARILAGLFDAVCENVMVLIKPSVSPRRVLLAGGVSRSPRVRRVFGQSLARMGMELIAFDAQDTLFLEALGCALLAAETPKQPPPLDELLLPAREMKLERLPPLVESLGKVHRMSAEAGRVLNAPSEEQSAGNGSWRRNGSRSGANLPGVVLGFDIGSTGAKAVALDAATNEVRWEGYRQTLGDPVGAAQDLLGQFAAAASPGQPVVAFGATGSGREIVGSLLTSCYGKEVVFIVNEIVAHATGALHYDSRVDTIFEIGGQDAKYVRLAEGRIIDCAMNEACSAGTGSFIEEQGRKFTGIQDVRQLGQAAMAAGFGVSLGQHCSVFMAEVIEEGVAAGVEPSALISGLYDSIIKNYLNRVKGNRSVGKVIFCQGMPFAADALAAAVARQTGCEVVVPPKPGTVGALGIALLAARELLPSSSSTQRQFGGLEEGAGQSPDCLSSPLDLSRFLTAKVEQKDTFVCRANSGCGGAGNRCRIERLRTVVANQRSCFTWGGGCSLYDKGTRKRKLPDLAPDPFREREELQRKLLAPLLSSRGSPRVALTDEFMLKGLFPFFAAFLYNAGFDLEIVAGADQATLKRGIQAANAAFCAPMQLFHGAAERMAKTGADRVFTPMLRGLPPAEGQRCAVVCPIVQASPDILRGILTQNCASSPRPSPPREEREEPPGRRQFEGSMREPNRRVLSPAINFGPGGLDSKEFRASCRKLASELGLNDSQFRSAWSAGLAVQREFERGCRELGRRALEFCRERNIVPVVVLGRGYTIFNNTLNSNVPAILREQGAIAIPVDCYPVEADTPHFTDMYWGYGHNILRAAHEVRRKPGCYALYCSNYSCGPDSFILHFVAYVMAGKPLAIIETDGHSGDAGTRTRVEAFLHCVEEHRHSHGGGPSPGAGGRRNVPANGQTARREETSSVLAAHGENGAHKQNLNDFSRLQFSGLRLRDVGRYNGETERMLVPYIGPASEAVAAVFRGVGLQAESLAPPDAASLQLGRRHTSGKECLPMPLTLGSLLQRLGQARDGERFVYVMPSTDGPCRFGVYNLLNQIVLNGLGWRDRVRIWSPKDTGYFDDLPAGTEMLMLAGILATDWLRQARLEVRPRETKAGEADALYARFSRELLAKLQAAGRGDLSLTSALWQVASGRLFGLRNLLERAGVEFAAVRGPGELPVVELTGEIYVRAVEFSNDFLIRKLEALGLEVRLAPQAEWIAYCSYLRRHQKGHTRLADSFSDYVEHRIEAVAFRAIGRHLGWPMPPSITETLAAARPYISPALQGEAVLTVGGSLMSWRRGEIDATVAVGPLECMPTKVAEAQFHHLADREGLLNLTLAFNGEPTSSAPLENFAFEVKERFRRKRELNSERAKQHRTMGKCEAEKFK